MICQAEGWYATFDNEGDTWTERIVVWLVTDMGVVGLVVGETATLEPAENEWFLCYRHQSEQPRLNPRFEPSAVAS